MASGLGTWNFRFHLFSVGRRKKLRLLVNLGPAMVTDASQALVSLSKNERKWKQLILKFSSSKNCVAWKLSPCTFVFPASPGTPMGVWVVFFFLFSPMPELPIRTHAPTSRKGRDDGRLKDPCFSKCPPWIPSSELVLCCGIESAFLQL